MRLFFLIIVFVLSTPIAFSNDSKIFSEMKKYLSSSNPTDLESFKKIFDSVSVNTQTEKHNPLYMAVQAENLLAVKWLLEQKARVDFQTQLKKTPLHLACIKRNFPITRLLVQYKADIQAKDYSNKTPFHYLAFSLNNEADDEKLRLEMMQWLAEQKADIYAQDKVLDTPLHMAAYDGASLIVSWLASKKSANVLNQRKRLPLHQALLGAFQAKKTKKPLNSYHAVISSLLTATSNINTQDENGNAALHWAAEYGFTEWLKQILERKPNINLQNNHGWSALHLACANSHLPSARLLVENNADINIKDNENTTPLYFAVGAGSKEITALLLKSKAQVFFTDARGKSVFDPKVEKKLTSLLKKLNLKK